MSTQYDITPGFWIDERSSNLYLYFGSNDEEHAITVEAFQKAIIRQIEVLSYVSDDASAVLDRFNINYGDTK